MDVDLVFITKDALKNAKNSVLLLHKMLCAIGETNDTYEIIKMVFYFDELHEKIMDKAEKMLDNIEKGR